MGTKRFSFELTDTKGKTAFRSPIHFQTEVDRDVCARTAHAAFVLSYGQRAYVRRVELTV